MIYLTEAITVRNNEEISVPIYAGSDKAFSKDIAGIFERHFETDHPIVTPGDLKENIYTRFTRTKFNNEGLPVSIKSATTPNEWVEIWNDREGIVIDF